MAGYLLKTIEERMNEYFNWLKQNYIFKELDSSTEITTPFKNHLNDFIKDMLIHYLIMKFVYQITD